MRAHNEDRCYISAEKGIFAVCDGMGGEACGEVAAEIAVEALNDFSSESIPEADVFFDRLNDTICEERDRRDLRNMGTTVALLSIRNGRAQSVNIGDSRVYIFRNGELEQISQDHTVVFGMYLNGSLTKEEVRTHIRSNVLYQFLGKNPGQGSIKAYVSESRQIEHGDQFLICSDGLTDMLPETEIEGIMRSASDIREAADNLMSAAMDAGGKDNITVIVIRTFE